MSSYTSISTSRHWFNCSFTGVFTNIKNSGYWTSNLQNKNNISPAFL